ncbi:MAG TPA: hypothetical protein VM716_01345 [Gemmatimonadales bacterium]|nr:hypothetical protein [Gemmatimonadales bacterium]
MSKVTFATTFVAATVFAVTRSPISPDAETARIRAHLAAVERQLRGEDVRVLTASQQAARTRNLDVLHQYWMRGVFPKNTGFPGRRVPYFVDQYGTRCAMAYLIERSGHGDLVARVAATNNNARIRELKTDPELVAWLQQNGLTADEAARIQPSYDGGWGPTTPDASAASIGYKTTTGVAIGAGAITTALNLAHTGISPTLTGVLGIAGGVAGLAAGGPNLDRSGSRRTLGFVNAGVGAVSVAFGVYRLASRAPTQARANVGPWVDARGAPGVSLNVSF